MRDSISSFLRTYTFFIYVFLYLPIVLVVLFSFNAGDYAADMKGFSFRWYGETWRDPFVLEAFGNSLLVASISATLATLFGTLASLALQNIRGWLRTLYDVVIYIAIIIPGIVIGIATLIFFVQFYGWLNPILQNIFGPSAPRLNLGLYTVIAAHTLFTMSIVLVIVRSRIAGMDRSLIEASNDLYATPWGTFWQVTLPQLFPAIMAGFLLAFTFSFDDFIVAFFVAGPNTTLPIYVFSSIRRGVTPKINAIATITLLVSLIFLFIVQKLLARNEGKASSTGEE